MKTPPASLEDDALSHEPDFSFRNTPPADLDFTGKVPVISAAQATAKLAQQETVDTTPIPVPVPAASPIMAVADPQPLTGENVNVTIVRERRQPSSGLAVAAFVLALAGLITPFFLLPFIVSILAIILGHVGARQAKRNNLTGRSFGIAAYIIGYLTVLVTAIIIAGIIVLGIGAYNGVDQLLQTYTK